MAKDSVFGMDLDNKAPCKSTDAGRIHAFCRPTCTTTFGREPGRSAAPAGGDVRQGWQA